MRKNEQSLREIWNTIKYTIINIMGVPEEKREQ